MKTRVFLIPAALKDAGDAMAAQMGWGFPVFVQPLSVGGGEPPVYWGFPAYWDTDEKSDAFAALWANPPAEAADLVAQILVDVQDGDDTQGHFDSFVATMGLTVVERAQ